MRAFRNIAISSVLTLLALVASSSELRAESAFMDKHAEGMIQGLEWEVDGDAIEFEVVERDGVPQAIVEGRFVRPDWSLLLPKHKPFDGTNGGFRSEIPLKGEITRLAIVSIGPLGEVEKSEHAIRFAGWKEYVKGFETQVPKRFLLSAGAGVSYIAYEDNRIASFSETALTVKAAATYALAPPSWDLGASVFFTALPITVSEPESRARFLGVNLRTGYALPFVPDPWRVALHVGGYYTTAFVSAKVAGASFDEFGFGSMMGPQVFPTVRRAFSGNRSTNAYFKFSPVASGVSFLSLSSREIAFGGGYSLPIDKRRVLSITLDAATLQLLIEDVRISSRSITLGASLGF